MNTAPASPWRLLVEPASCGVGYAALLYPPEGDRPLYSVRGESAVVAQVDASAWLRRHLYLPPAAPLPLVMEKEEA